MAKIRHKMIRIRFNAFDRNSSASFSETAVLHSIKQFAKASAEFDGRVPFPRYYRESEILEGETPAREKELERLDEE